MSRKPFTLRKGNYHVRISPWRKSDDGPSYWRFGWKDGDRWRYVTRATRADITEAAHAALDDMQEAGFAFSALPGDRKRFLRQVHDLCPAGDEAEVLRLLEERKPTT